MSFDWSIPQPSVPVANDVQEKCCAEATTSSPLLNSVATAENINPALMLDSPTNQPIISSNAPSEAPLEEKKDESTTTITIATTTATEDIFKATIEKENDISKKTIEEEMTEFVVLSTVAKPATLLHVAEPNDVEKEKDNKETKKKKKTKRREPEVIPPREPSKRTRKTVERLVYHSAKED